MVIKIIILKCTTVITLCSINGLSVRSKGTVPTAYEENLAFETLNVAYEFK